MKKGILLPLGVVAAFSLVASAASAQSTAPQAPVKVAPPQAVRDKANDPKPPASAKQVKSIGKGKATANTANTPDDTDSLWIEKIDKIGRAHV